LPFKFGGAFCYVTLYLCHPIRIVFRVTLGTMCHFSLGGGVDIYVSVCYFVVLLLLCKFNIYIYIYIFDSVVLRRYPSV